MTPPIFRRLPTIFVFSFAVHTALAWDYEGHRTVNQLALASLPADFPAFVKTDVARERISFLAGEPDRWRNVPDLPLRHASGPDHYLDMEDLEEIGMPLESLSEFREIFSIQFAQLRAAHPDKFPAIDPAKNSDRTRELTGFLPWAIAENFARLKSAFSYLKTFEETGGTPEEIANAQANAIYYMGVLGHFVGDSSQPLHTTKHHHGWVGENPRGFTTASQIHSWIDGGFLRATGGLSLPTLSQAVKPARGLEAGNVLPGQRDWIFSAALKYVTEQHAQLVPLYELEKSGKLKAENPESREGRAFLEKQILVAGNMLGSLWFTAFRDAPADSFLRTQLLLRQGKPTK